MNPLSETELTILWSGENALAVHKPAGLSTQAPNVADSLELRLRSQLGRQSEYLAFPHRLDRPVSGVILVATTRRAANLLGSQFESRKVKKTYLACVSGDAMNVDPTWTDWVRKRSDHARVDVVEADSPESKLCETNVEPLCYHSDLHCTVLRLSPTTGRMHQLRVQSSHRGHPILGDEGYGWVQPLEGERVPFEPWCIALHAESISFHEPKSGRLVRVEAAPRPEIARFMDSH